MCTTTCKYIMNPEFIINIFILEVHIIFKVYVIIINVFNYMLDMNIYKYADVLECEYANVYEYKLVETQKMEKQKRKKNISTYWYQLSDNTPMSSIWYRVVLSSATK